MMLHEHSELTSQYQESDWTVVGQQNSFIDRTDTATATDTISTKELVEIVPFSEERFLILLIRKLNGSSLDGMNV